MKKINNSRHENNKECHPVLKTYCKSAIISCISNFVYQKKFQVGGSFGVFFGGFFSDRIVTRLGLHSRLWVLSAFTMLSVPFAFLTLYTPVSSFPKSRNLSKKSCEYVVQLKLLFFSLLHPG